MSFKIAISWQWGIWGGVWSLAGVERRPRFTFWLTFFRVIYYIYSSVDCFHAKTVALLERLISYTIH